MARYIGHVFKGEDGWRWRIRSRNGRNVACSGEAFSDRTAARRAFTRFCAGALNVSVAFREKPKGV